MILIPSKLTVLLMAKKSCTNLGMYKILANNGNNFPFNWCRMSSINSSTWNDGIPKAKDRRPTKKFQVFMLVRKYSTIEHIRGSLLLNHLWIVHPDPKSTLLTRKNAGKKKTVQSSSNTSCVSKFIIIYTTTLLVLNPTTKKNQVVVTSLNRPPLKKIDDGAEIRLTTWWVVYSIMQYPPWNSHSTWKWMVGRWVSF